MDKIELGDEVVDEITGIKGIAIGISKWITGCDTVVIQPPGVHEGKPFKTTAFDITRLKKIQPKVVIEKPPGQGVG